MVGKRCNKCEAMKPLADFYARQGKCKECTKEAVRLNYERNREHYLAYDRERNNLPHRLATRKKAADKWAEDPRHFRVINRVYKALRAGKITKPSACTVCARTDRKLEAHHHDYNKPLEVVWLCRSCHRKTHVALASAAG